MSLEQENFDGLERAFRDKFKDWEVPPPPGAWDAISGKVQQKSPFANLKLLAPLALLLFIGSTYWYFSNEQMDGQSLPLTTSQSTVASPESKSDAVTQQVQVAQPNQTISQSSANAENGLSEEQSTSTALGSISRTEVSARGTNVLESTQPSSGAAEASEKVDPSPHQIVVAPKSGGKQHAVSAQKQLAGIVTQDQEMSEVLEVTKTKPFDLDAEKSVMPSTGRNVNAKAKRASKGVRNARLSRNPSHETASQLAVQASNKEKEDNNSANSKSDIPEFKTTDTESDVLNEQKALVQESHSEPVVAVDKSVQATREQKPFVLDDKQKVETKPEIKEEPKLVAETKGRAESNGSVWAIDAYLMPRFTFRKVVASTSSDLHIRQMEARSPLAADRIGFEIGGRVARQIGKLFEINTGFHFANINEELTFKAEEGTPSWHQIHQNPDGTVSLNPMYKSGSITQRSSFYYGGLNLGASVYLNKSQRLRISSGAGVNWLMRGYTTREFDGDQIANYSFPSITAPFEQINMHVYGGFAYLHPISTKLTFIFEPTVNFFLFSTYQSREPVTVTPTTMGANFMLRYKL